MSMRNKSLIASILAGVLSFACSDLTELQAERRQEADDLSNYVQEIAAQNGATLIISESGKTTLSITQAGHPLRGVIYEIPASALPAVEIGEQLVLEITPGSVLDDGLTPEVVQQLTGLTDQTVVGTVVEIDLHVFPLDENGQLREADLADSGTLTLPIESCVPALLKSYLGTADLTSNSESLVTDTTVKFTARQVVAEGIGKGKFAPVLGGSKVCGGLESSQPPIAGGLQFSVKEDKVLSAQLSVVDDNQDDLVFTLVTATTSGSVTLEEDGSFVYTPNSDFYGQDKFEFMANDGFEDSNTGTATIFVANVNDAPTAYGTTISASVNVQAAGTVTGTDIDDTIATLSFRITSNPTHGTALMQGSGTFEYDIATTNAACAAGGTDTFNIVASDLKDDSADAVVTVTVNGCTP